MATYVSGKLFVTDAEKRRIIAIERECFDLPTAKQSTWFVMRFIEEFGVDLACELRGRRGINIVVLNDAPPEKRN
jgi:hypothetical protein